MIRRCSYPPCAASVAIAAIIVASGCRSDGIHGEYPGPAPRWSEYGGSYCEYCGGGPRLSVWSRGEAGAGTAALQLQTDACIDDFEVDVWSDDPDNRAELVYTNSDGTRESHAAQKGTITIHRCSGSKQAPFADVSFDLELEAGARITGRISTPLEYRAGFE